MSDPRRARSFITPRGPDGGGVIVALQGAGAEQQFMAIRPYWAVDEAPLEALREELAAVERELTQTTDFTRVTRLKGRRDDLKRQLASADLDTQRREAERRRQRGEQARNVPPGRCRAGQAAGGGYIYPCSCGQHVPDDPARFAADDEVHEAVKSVLIAASRTHQHRASPAAAGQAAPQFAAPVPYYEAGGA